MSNRALEEAEGLLPSAEEAEEFLSDLYSVVAGIRTTTEDAANHTDLLPEDFGGRAFSELEDIIAYLGSIHGRIYDIADDINQDFVRRYGDGGDY